jgi:hypothetical protein
MTPTIWSRTARDLLFEELVKQFGPYKTWKRAEYPSKAKQKEFVKFCVDIAVLVGAKSWRAVTHQIKFAVGVQSQNGCTTGTLHELASLYLIWLLHSRPVSFRMPTFQSLWLGMVHASGRLMTSNSPLKNLAMAMAS